MTAKQQVAMTGYCYAVMRGKALDKWGNRLQNNGRHPILGSPVRMGWLCLGRLGT
jgi:hypothetical protein